MKNTSEKTQKRIRRHVRVRAKISGTADRPRLAVFRSNRYISGQLIDDEKAHTVAAATSKGLKEKTYTERAHAAGKALAESAKKAGVTKVVFDRGGFLYVGRVKAFAEGAREGGLEF